MSKYSEQVRKGAKCAAEWFRINGGSPDMLLAIETVTMPMLSYERGQNALYDACCEVAEVPYEFLGQAFACTPGRTKEEVLAVFDRIANS